MKKTALFLLFIFLFQSHTFSLELPNRSKYDHRIKFVTYNAEDVVQLKTVIGIATHILLEEGEHYIAHAFGDSDSYAFSLTKNHLFIKQKEAQTNTNLVIITDYRHYNIQLLSSSNRSEATYELVFLYPEIIEKRSRQARKQEAIERSFYMKIGSSNLSYTMTGNIDIAPINAWDNGSMTYFKFQGNTEIPAFYMQDKDGKEILVNYTVVGRDQNIIMIHKTNPKWILRLGKRTLKIFNEAYPSNASSQKTGTTSPAVHRVSKENIHVRS